MINKFYVYALLDPRKSGEFIYDYISFKYEPFYIGKGCGKRAEQHIKLSYKNKNQHKDNKIRKILKNDLTPLVVKIKENLSEADAYKLEKEIIKIIGLNNLTNITEGGIGRNSESMKGDKNPMFGKKRPKWIIEKMVEASKENYENKKLQKGKKIEEIIGKEKAKIAKEKMSLARKGRSWEDYFGEEKAKKIKEIRSKQRTGSKHSEETKQKIKIKINTLENIEKRVAASLKQREDKFLKTFNENKELITSLLENGFKFSEIKKRLNKNITRYILKKILNKLNTN